MKKLSTAVFFTLIYLFFYVPIFVLIIFSFNNSALSHQWHGFTWAWYQQLFQDKSVLTITEHSFTIAILAATFATTLGSLATIFLLRYRFFGRKILYGLIFVLIILPDIVMGIALLLLFYVFHIHLGFWSLLLAHITFCIPFVTATVYSRMLDLNPQIFEAAIDLGASEWRVTQKIIIPMLMPAIVAGWFLSFTLSLDDVIISSFVSGPDYEILPLHIYAMAKLGVSPEINALCTLLFILTLIVVGCSQLALRKKHR